MNNRGLFALCCHTAGTASCKDAIVGLTEIQHSLIIGTLLGDGAMRCKRNALLEINHCAAQKNYVDWKFEVLREFVASRPKLRRGNGGREAYRFTTRSLPELTPYYRAFYEGSRKRIPDIALTPLALAVWFMDDGCKSHRAAYFNTQQFDLESQVRILDALREQCGIDGTLNRDKQYFRVRVAVRSMPRLRELIGPYLLPEMRYKLPR